jgi:Na+/melibiose symporter-like transporter
MRSVKESQQYSEFRRIFNFRDPLCTGRTALLINTALASFGNIFITGVFYTGFLSINGIDIVRVGIITFIPYIAWGFSLFTPLIFRKLRHRRGLLLFNHLFYYLCILLATTVMPLLVRDSAQRTLWFAVFLFAGNVSNALLGSGAFAWHVNFIPDGEDRNAYFSYTNLTGSLVSTVFAIGSSLLADSLKGSPQQAQIIMVLRFVAMGVFVINGLQLFLIPQELPYHKQGLPTIKEIFTTPFKSRKFMLTAWVAILWNAIANVNGSTWPYYVINTMGLGYTYMYIGTVVYTLGNIFLMKYWRRAIRNYSWFSVLLFSVFFEGITELLIGFSSRQTVWVYVAVSILQGIDSVGLNLVFANLVFINMPRGNRDSCVTFWNLVCNLAVLAGSMLGTGFLSLVEPHAPYSFAGLPFYGSQFLTWIKFACIMLMCVYVRWAIPRMQPDEENLR